MSRPGQFRPLSASTVRWCRLDGHGYEHLTLEPIGRRITATSVITCANADQAFGAWYQIFLDSKWHIKALSVHLTDSRWLIARSPATGQWCDGDGSALNEFEGCSDIDLPATPFTHTLAVRRLELAKGEARELDVLSVPFDSLAPVRCRQRFTCLNPGARYRHENLQTGAAADIEVDQDGLVINEPGAFKRL